MFLTNVLFKKVKAKYDYFIELRKFVGLYLVHVYNETFLLLNRDILVCLESIVSGHKINLIRTRLGDKMEIIRYDPWSK